MTRPRVLVSSDALALAQEGAELLAGFAAEAQHARGSFRFALSGGTTPLGLHRALAALPAGRIDWSRTELYFSDERAVPPDHPASNFASARDALIAPLGLTQVHRIDADDGDTSRAAAAYSVLLDAAGPLDVVLLGLGEDGHTASLFPGSHPEPGEPWAIATRAPPTFPIPDRVTLSYASLLRARAVLVLVAGANKRRALRATLDTCQDLPLRHLLRRSEELLFLTDASAVGVT